MERMTLRAPKQQIEEIERMVETGELSSQSETVRSAVRDALNEQMTDKRQHESTNKRGWTRV